jgi:Bifunctional DNA primase/polymerase, N-terminal
VSGTPRDGWRAFLIRDTPIATAADAPRYWAGVPVRRTADPEDAALGRRLMAEGWRVAVLPERSGLAILDCDVEFEWRDTGGNSWRLVKARDGVADLRRLAAEREKPVPPTYEASSPSGGTHLYYRQNEHCPVTSHGYRDGWYIDVKASPNTYAVAPPTPGYEVVRDTEPAVLPYWLARHIQRLGTARQRRAPGGGGPLTGRARDGILAFVTASNAAGGWNNAIYWAARRLFDAGEDPETLTAALLEAAAPHDDREKAKAMRTIESARHGHDKSKGFS